MGYQLDSLLENLYTQADFWASNKDVLLEYMPNIFNIDDILSKKVMRNKDERFVPHITHAPYHVTHSLMRDLFRRIIIIPCLDTNVSKLTSDDSCINQVGREFIIVYQPNDIPQLIDSNGNYTPDFMLALRLRNHFNNEAFKLKVEEELLHFSKVVTFNSVEYFVPYDNDSIFDGSFSNLSGIAKKIVLENVSFFWRQ